MPSAMSAANAWEMLISNNSIAARLADGTRSAPATLGRHFPQFIAVIDNCSTVAIDTQTRYGICASATQR